MFSGVLVEKISEQILSKPDVPISLLICLLVISGLFYLLMRSYKRSDRVALQLEASNTLLSTIIETVKTLHDGQKTNRDILQRVEVCLSNNSVQINNMSSELKSHRDECNRKLFVVNGNR